NGGRQTLEIMNMAADRGLTGRDVIAKTFSSKSRKGYDPAEVDAYLEQVAAQIDSLHGEVARSNKALEICRTESAKLATAPPPPMVAAEPEALQVPEVPQPVVAAVAPPPPPVVEPVAVAATPAQQSANDEAAEVILRMAQKASADAIGEARVRADEIIAEAEIQSTEIARESDRKAFEAASRLQTDLRNLEGDVDTRNVELEQIQGSIVLEQHRLRQMADDLSELASTYSPPVPAPIETDADIIDLSAAEDKSDAPSIS
ncbi:MAG: DivIVA domain-containing protein, partial [Acidimicrobiales bacterium]